MVKRNVQEVAYKLLEKHLLDRPKPDILCIGVQKGGTTWLHANLSRHPQVWSSPVKELHFLSHGYHIPPHSIKKVLFSSHWFYHGLRTLLKAQIGRACSPHKADGLFDEKMQWLLKYALGKRSYEWYRSLFPPTQKLCIDISPSYYTVPEAQIRQHQAYNPKTKIIVIIRNPIDRMWSSALMILCRNRGRSISEVDNAEFIALFDNSYQKWRPYLQTIALWQKYFDNVYVEFYDRLNENPAAFFTNICAFLGIAENAVTSDLDKPVNQGIQAELPLHLRRYLFEQYGGEINEMADSGIDYAKKWLDEHENIVNRNG